MRYSFLSASLFALALATLALPVCAAEGSMPPTDEFEKAEPVTVIGNDDVAIDKKLIETDGDALTVTGNGDVKVSASRLIAKG
ncbi:MAG TPA: hypothetical protein PKJ56_12705, partial [Promineifilum sp.]|nr:hypothetical protein [Promineifilum sp.]